MNKQIGNLKVQIEAIRKKKKNQMDIVELKTIPPKWKIYQDSLDRLNSKFKMASKRSQWIKGLIDRNYLI